MTTECPHCKALNDSDLPEDTIAPFNFDGEIILTYPQILRCFHCKKHYVWSEDLGHRWRGVPVPGFVDVI